MASIPALARLPKVTQNAILGKVGYEQMPAGSVIFAEGDPGDKATHTHNTHNYS